MKNVTYIIFGILILFFIIIIGNHFFGILREGLTMGEGPNPPPECPPGGWKDTSPQAIAKVTGGREFLCGDAPNEKKYKSNMTYCPNKLVHNKATGLCDERTLLSATPVVASATPVVASATPVVASATPVVASATPVVASGDAGGEGRSGAGSVKQQATGGRVQLSTKIINV